MKGEAGALRAALVTWYRAHARDLPWRRDPTPYRVLLSELMLQQTRVETVIPYFERFVRRWPTLEALAAAEEQEVLSAWAGLGYYRRARNLQAAARAARAGLPREVEALRALPGIGPYTAGAIASIAFGVPAAAVDGNVERVLARVDGYGADPHSTEGRRHLAGRALELSGEGVASDVTQGLMELGATVCTPRQPRCGVCPWTDACVGRREGRIDELPRKAPKKAPLAVRAACGILETGGRLLLGRRPDGLLGGLWEPIGDVWSEGEAEQVVVSAFRRRAGVEVEVLRLLGEVEHVFTHRRLRQQVFAVSARSVEPVSDGSYDELALVDAERVGVPLSRLAEKVLALRQRPLWAPLAAEAPLPWRR